MTATKTTRRTVKSPAAAQMGPTVKSPEQQAELDRLRAEKQARIDAVPTDLQAQVDAALGNVRQALGLSDFEGPSFKRQAAAFFGSMVIAGGVGYVIGEVAAWAMIGCFLLTGSVFMMWLTFALAMLISLYLGFKIAQHVGNYVLSGQIDEDLAKVKHTVTGWIGRAKSLVVTSKVPA